MDSTGRQGARHRKHEEGALMARPTSPEAWRSIDEEVLRVLALDPAVPDQDPVHRALTESFSLWDEERTAADGLEGTA